MMRNPAIERKHPMPTIQSNGIELAYDSFGEAGAVPVLLIAGLGTQMIRWSEVFCRDLAARGLRVIRFDNRDSGRSTHFTHMPPPDFAAMMAGARPQPAYTLGDMADDALGLLDDLGIARAHLVGRSMGGMIAQIMASSHPERVLSLTSIMSSSGNPALPPPDPAVIAMMMGPAPDPRVDEAAYVDHRLRFARRIAAPGLPFDEAAQSAIVLEELQRGADAGASARQMMAIAMDGDRRARLAGISVPSLIVHGDADPLFPLQHGHDCAGAIPGARLLAIPGMGHDLPPAFYAKVIDAMADMMHLPS
jgi:pimeloyl-ACP methyl ester carboxylesterase